MHPTISEQRETVAALCRRFRVKRLDVFGSAARADFDPSSSDVDLLVQFERETGRAALDSFMGLKEALEDLFGRPVDLVEATAVRNPYLRADIERSRELLYAA